VPSFEAFGLVADIQSYHAITLKVFVVKSFLSYQDRFPAMQGYKNKVLRQRDDRSIDWLT
jgi:hypothetical protein